MARARCILLIVALVAFTTHITTAGHLVTVCGDATYALHDDDDGTICQGQLVDARAACPRQGSIAVADCHDRCPSWNKTTHRCVLLVKAKCERLGGGHWGCVVPSMGGPTRRLALPLARSNDFGIRLGGDPTAEELPADDGSLNDVAPTVDGFALWFEASPANTVPTFAISCLDGHAPENVLAKPTHRPSGGAATASENASSTSDTSSKLSTEGGATPALVLDATTKPATMSQATKVDANSTQPRVTEASNAPIPSMKGQTRTDAPTRATSLDTVVTSQPRATTVEATPWPRQSHLTTNAPITPASSSQSPDHRDSGQVRGPSPTPHVNKTPALTPLQDKGDETSIAPDVHQPRIPTDSNPDNGTTTSLPPPSNTPEQTPQHQGVGDDHNTSPATTPRHQGQGEDRSKSPASTPPHQGQSGDHNTSPASSSPHQGQSDDHNTSPAITPPHHDQGEDRSKSPVSTPQNQGQDDDRNNTPPTSADSDRDKGIHSTSPPKQDGSTTPAPSKRG
ncbi:Aste57867_25459 [Aphanomyces stellatus]|uniref:Aste57867_25459 protein n=1 Tax=Aphanomyces stellatus TaxID=120398 RepID=A0A485LT52_9STRA|nr:hypothetical protein As57867_025380 [Aphanomyces stellatus]VFU02082.1 Aste57867_25459 [Aphanomyces stellatus]